MDDENRDKTKHEPKWQKLNEMQMNFLYKLRNLIV